MLLGLDLGTGSAKAVLLDPDGGEHGEGSSKYPVVSPRPSWAETDPEAWWEAVGRAVREAVGDRRDQVTAIGLSGQMHGVVLSSTGSTPLRPAILWADSRAEAELAAYRDLPRALFTRLANPAAAGLSGPTLLWLARHEPGRLEEARWALQPKDWLRLRMTGEAAAEPSDASATLLYDVAADAWADDVIAALGLPRDRLPPLVASEDVAGRLTPAAAEHLGLREGLPVAAGAADTAAAALGGGLLEPGPVQVGIGTGGQVVAPLDVPRADPHARTHLFRAAVRGHWYLMGATQSAGLTLEWVRRALGVSWEELYEEAFAVAPGSEGVTFLPYLSGERTPHIDSSARAAWSGLQLGHRRAHLLRAALEGVAFGLADAVDAVEAAGIPAPELRLAGGGGLDPRWRRLLADVFARPLRPVSAVASARGAALLAGLASGAIPDAGAATALAPEPGEPVGPGDEREAYAAARKRFAGLYPATRRVREEEAARAAAPYPP